MSRRQRCFSKWNKISVVNDNKLEIASFQLNELGQLENKIKTQKRRKIHEGKRARKTINQSKVSLPATDKAENAQLVDQLDSTFVSLQNSSENDNQMNVSSFLLLDQETDLSQSLFLQNSEDMFESIDLKFYDIDF